MLYSAHIMALTEDSGQDNDSEERRFGKDSNGEIDCCRWCCLRSSHNTQQYVTVLPTGLQKCGHKVISICRERREYTPMMDITDKESYRSLYSELKQYEKRGIDILMDGYQVSPMQIVTAYMAKEEGAYMRDYVMDQNGRLESLTFTDVDELNVDKFGLSVLTP